MIKPSLLYLAASEQRVEWPLIEALGKAFDLSFGAADRGYSGFDLGSSRCVALDAKGVQSAAFTEYVGAVILRCSHLPVALLNSNLEVVRANQRALSGVKGVFLTGTSPQAVVHGLLGISEGLEYWPSQLLSGNNRAPLVNFSGDTATESLTRRELQIIDLLVAGRSNEDIATALGISSHTVKVHLYRAYKKLNVKNRFEAYALLQGDRQKAVRGEHAERN